jgi:hypothetical protein
MADTAARPGLRPWNGPRLVRWTGRHGEIRNELQFQ